MGQLRVREVRQAALDNTAQTCHRYIAVKKDILQQMLSDLQPKHNIR
jgi:hypothetical protein